MKQLVIGFSMLILSLSGVAASAVEYLSFKGHVLSISTSSGDFANKTTATIEIILEPGVSRKDNYSICQDISDRDYAALMALLIDSRSRNKEASFVARPITNVTDFYCIISMVSP